VRPQGQDAKKFVTFPIPGPTAAPIMRDPTEPPMTDPLPEIPRVRAPEFPDALDWIHTGGHAIRLADLRGRVVLLDFWTYGCINCIHLAPQLHELARRIPDARLHVVKGGGHLFLLDEPESALSFTGNLGLVGLLHAVANRGNAQVVVATHSPLVAATPGARVIEVGDWGLRDCSWDDLAIVQHWRSFLDAPARYLRHVL